MDRLLHWLLRSDAAERLARHPYDDLDGWWGHHQRLAMDWEAPIDRAIVGGYASDRLGFAFTAGYRAALHQLVPEIGPDAVPCLCVTEEGGGHPRAIETRLSPRDGGFRLDGDKEYATLADRCDVLLVAATTGEVAGRPKLWVVKVAPDAPGVLLRPLPAPPFAPEVTHYHVSLRDVHVTADQLLPGDGYDAYIRPFRTVEDIFVSAALLAWLLRVARAADWPQEVRGEMVYALVGLRALAALPPGSPEVHAALGGWLQVQRHLLEVLQPHWERADPTTRTRWLRDRALLAVAADVRRERFEAAWRKLARPPSSDARRAQD